MSEILRVARIDGWVELTLHRPECRNALSRALIAALTDALRAAEADSGLRAVIITGTPPAFCAGLDLREVASTHPDQAEHDASSLLNLFETLDGMSKPVIAAINGPAVAGGAGLASVCDLVICGLSGSIGYPEIKRGLVAAIVMTYLRRLVGERRAKYLLLSGETLAAERAVEFGLANECVPDSELHARSRHFAALFASYPPLAMAETKRLWSRIRGLEHAAAVEEARRLNASMRLTQESRAGVTGFLSKP